MPSAYLLHPRLVAFDRYLTIIHRDLYFTQCLEGNMDYRPPEDRSWIFEWYKQRGILASNQTLDCRKGRCHWSDLEGINLSNAQILHFSNIQDLSFDGLFSVSTTPRQHDLASLIKFYRHFWKYRLCCIVYNIR